MIGWLRIICAVLTGMFIGAAVTADSGRLAALALFSFWLYWLVVQIDRAERRPQNRNGPYA